MQSKDPQAASTSPVLDVSLTPAAQRPSLHHTGNASPSAEAHTHAEPASKDSPVAAATAHVPTSSADPLQGSSKPSDADTNSNKDEAVMESDDDPTSHDDRTDSPVTPPTLAKGVGLAAASPLSPVPFQSAGVEAQQVDMSQQTEDDVPGMPDLKREQVFRSGSLPDTSTSDEPAQSLLNRGTESVVSPGVNAEGLLKSLQLTGGAAERPKKKRLGWGQGLKRHESHPIPREVGSCAGATLYSSPSPPSFF